MQLNEAQIRIEAGQNMSVHILPSFGVIGVYNIKFILDGKPVYLMTQHKHIRGFKTLDSAASVLKSIGVESFIVELI